MQEALASLKLLAALYLFFHAIVLSPDNISFFSQFLFMCSVVKIQVIGSKYTPPTDEVEHIDRKVSRIFYRFNENRDLAVIVDFNNVLAHVHDDRKSELPSDLSMFYFAKIYGDHNTTYYLRHDAEIFLLALSQVAEVFLWSSRNHRNLETAIDKCLTQAKRCLSGWLSQNTCHVSSWTFDNPPKPMFFKKLETFWYLFPKFNKSNTLVLDDSLYKMYFNDPSCYVILPQLEKQNERQWEDFLKKDVAEFVCQWAESCDRAKTVSECPFDARKEARAQSNWDIVDLKVLQKRGKIASPEMPKRPHKYTRPKRT